MVPTPASRIASSRFSVPTVLFRKYLPGSRHRLADQRVGGEVDDAIESVRGEDLGEPPAIGQAAALERSPLDRPVVSLAHVVEHDGLMPRGGEQLRRMTPDVSGSAGHENPHQLLPTRSSEVGGRRSAGVSLGAAAKRLTSDRDEWPRCARPRESSLRTRTPRGRSLRRSGRAMPRTTSRAPACASTATVPPLPPPVIFAP